MTKDNKTVVLLVDDNAEQTRLFYSPLIASAIPDAMIVTATDAGDAKQKISQFKPDVVLLDVVLPESELNGDIPYGQEYLYSRQVADSAREANPAAKIILLSSYADQHIENYPGVELTVNPLNYRVDLPEALYRLQLQERGPEAHAENTPPAQIDVTGREPKHISRILQVRRSPWHDGSKEGMDDSWSYKMSVNNRADDERER
jgi:CheY-like chemotaxis protein